MCSKLFNDNLYYKIERIYDRIYPIECTIEDETKKNRLLFINFKSFEILNKDHREKFFEIITKTSPDYICLTEALVPSIFINKSGELCDLNEYILHDVVHHPIKTDSSKFANNKRQLYISENIKRIYTKEGDEHIFIDKKGNVNLNNVWIAFFVDNGYNFILFGNPTMCPYGKNWGNCIISKKKPSASKILLMDDEGFIKSHEKDTNLVDKDTKETRCMIHITINEGVKHHILCTHLEDSNKDVRAKQVTEIIRYIGDENLQGKITLVGDLNALNEESYTQSERVLLKKLNNDYLPTTEIPIFNKFFKAFDTKDTKVTLINKDQKYESVFQKCVSHGYSNTYTHSLLIFTDATTFDHQPLLLLKSSEESLLPILSEKP
jgi:hypothetical protein